jgi:hypothetical protein
MVLVGLVFGSIPQPLAHFRFGLIPMEQLVMLVRLWLTFRLLPPRLPNGS